MASRHKSSEEEIDEIERVREANQDKRAEARLKALELPDNIVLFPIPHTHRK